MMSKGFFKYFIIYIFSSCKIVYKIFILFCWRYFVFSIPNLCLRWLLNLWIVLVFFCWIVVICAFDFIVWLLDGTRVDSGVKCVSGNTSLLKLLRTFCLASRRNTTLIRKGFLSIGFSPLFLSLNSLNNLLCFFLHLLLIKFQCVYFLKR